VCSHGHPQLGLALATVCMLLATRKNGKLLSDRKLIPASVVMSLELKRAKWLRRGDILNSCSRISGRGSSNDTFNAFSSQRPLMEELELYSLQTYFSFASVSSAHHFRASADMNEQSNVFECTINYNSLDPVGGAILILNIVRTFFESNVKSTTLYSSGVVGQSILIF
jgi:hypothetical protein